MRVPFRIIDLPFRITGKCFRYNKEALLLVTEEPKWCADEQLDDTEVSKLCADTQRNVTEELKLRTEEVIHVTDYSTSRTDTKNGVHNRTRNVLSTVISDK